MKAAGFAGVNKMGAGSAHLSGLAKEIMDAYAAIQDATPATVAGEIWNTNALVGYFAVRRAEREKIIGADQVRSLLKSSEPLLRAAAAAACNEVFEHKSTEMLKSLIRDTHPVVIEAALDAMANGVTRSETGKILLEALPKFSTPHRHKAMQILGKLKYRQAVGTLEEIFRKRDGIDSPAACRALTAIQGRSFMDGITEYLYPDNPIELHTAILECMAENPAPVYFAKATQLLKTLRNKQSIVEVVRRIALWSNQGVDLAITLLGSSDLNLADAATEGLIRHLRSIGTLPPGFLQKLSRTSFDVDASAQHSSSHISLSQHLETLESKLSEIFSSKPDPDFQQLFFMALTAEKHFLRPKLVQLAAGRWGEEASKQIEMALQLDREEAGLVRIRLQSRWAAQAEQQSLAMTVARMIESIGAAELKSPVKEIIRHLDTPHLPIQMAAVGSLALIGGSAEALEIEKRIPPAHWMLKRKMSWSLSRLSRDNPTAGLFKLCEDLEPLVRISAVRALEGIRHEKAYNVLLKSLEDPDERVRSAACAGLRGFPERKEVQSRLFQMLEDTDARVRANTIESLEHILAGDPKELRFRIKPFLSDPNARVVVNTAKALFPIEPDVSLPVIETYLRAPDPNLRAGALWALGTLGRPDTFLCLHFHSLREKDSYVWTFIDKGHSIMQDHLFYRDAKYLLLSTRSGGLK